MSTNIQSRTFNRISVGLEGIVEANVFIRGCEEKVIFYVVDDYVRKPNYEVLLGILFILQIRLTLEYSTEGLLKVSFAFSGARIILAVGSVPRTNFPIILNSLQN